MPQLQLIVWSVSANRSTKQPFQAEHHVETAQGLQLVNHGFIEVHMRTAREHLCSMDALRRVAANARLTQVPSQTSSMSSAHSLTHHAYCVSYRILSLTEIIRFRDCITCFLLD